MSLSMSFYYIFTTVEYDTSVINPYISREYGQKVMVRALVCQVTYRGRFQDDDVTALQFPREPPRHAASSRAAAYNEEFASVNDSTFC